MLMLFTSGPLRWRRTPVQDVGPLPVRTPAPDRPAVFIGQDGTLVDDLPYNTDPALLRFKPDAVDALKALSAEGFALLVVTHQSGLARGYVTRSQFARLQGALEARLREAGVVLLDSLVCPHAPAPDGRPSCLCRKPAPGLLVRAARRHGIDLARSWMVGHTLDDIEAGHRAGCRTLLLGGDAAESPRLTPLRHPDARCDGWDAVAQRITPMPAEPPAT